MLVLVQIIHFVKSNFFFFSTFWWMANNYIASAFYHFILFSSTCLLLCIKWSDNINKRNMEELENMCNTIQILFLLFGFQCCFFLCVCKIKNIVNILIIFMLISIAMCELSLLLRTVCKCLIIIFITLFFALFFFFAFFCCFHNEYDMFVCV